MDISVLLRIKAEYKSLRSRAGLLQSDVSILVISLDRP